MRFRLLKRLGLAVSAFIWLIQPVYAQQSMTVLSSPLPIFSKVKQNGQMTGYSVEFTREVLNRAGYTAEFESLPFARLLMRARKGEGMITTGIGRTPEREDDFYWIAPMTANVIGLYSKRLSDIQDLLLLNKAISVSVLRGDYRAELLAKYPGVTVVEFNNWQQAIGAVLKDRVDAVFLSGLGVGLTCLNAGFDCSDLRKVYSHDVLFSYMAMPKTEANRHIAQQVAKAAAEYVKSQEFVRLTENWLPPLRNISNQVSVTDGVLTMGAIEATVQLANPLWVITHLEPPFSYRDERGRLAGYAVELTQNVLVEAGLQTEILVAPWERIIGESRSKSDVLVFSLARTAEREDDFHWVTPITQNAYSIFGHTPSIDSKVLADLPKHSKIAVLNGDFRQSIVEKAGFTSVPGNDWSEVLRRFIQGEADFLFFSDGGVELVCKTSGLDCSQVYKNIEYQLATTYLALSKKGTSPKLVEQLENAAIQFKQSDDYRSMVEHWLHQFSLQTAPSMHESDGIIKLWAKPHE